MLYYSHLITSLAQEISNNLMSHVSTLMTSELPSETTAVQQRTFVTFVCLPPDVSEYDEQEEPTIILLERRHLISGSRTTGFRTWEAALHLGSYLLTPEGSALIRNKSVLELGAGTGFLSILCAKHLQAKHVTATDGDEGVVEALRENLFFNELDNDSKVLTSILRWGHGIKGTWVEEDCEAWPYDVVLGADIVSWSSHSMLPSVKADDMQTYDSTIISALVSTLCLLFDLRPLLQVIISGAVRNVETFEKFRHACRTLQVTSRLDAELTANSTK